MYSNCAEIVSALLSNPKVGVRTRLEEKVFFCNFFIYLVWRRGLGDLGSRGRSEGVGATIWAPLVIMQFARISCNKILTKIRKIDQNYKPTLCVTTGLWNCHFSERGFDKKEKYSFDCGFCRKHRSDWNLADITYLTAAGPHKGGRIMNIFFGGQWKITIGRLPAHHCQQCFTLAVRWR